VIVSWLLALPFMVRHGRSLVVWLIVFALLLLQFLLVENRFGSGADVDASGLKILNWNASQFGGVVSEGTGTWIAQQQPDIAIVSGAHSAAVDRDVRAWLEPNGRAFRMGRFMILTKVPMVEVGWVVAADQMRIAYILIRTDAAQRPLVLYLVDLPSDPQLSRAQIAATARRHIEQSSAPAPDIVLGDFNMTRDSASLRALFPRLQHAFDLVGHGYGATFPRDRPLYHIDHALVGPEVEATGYELLDPGMTRHWAQVLTVQEK
jgi:hypothetical protein